MDDQALPAEFRDPAVLRFMGLMLTWREGDPIPQFPPGVTKDNLPDLVAKLEDPAICRAVAVSLSHRYIDPGHSTETSKSE